MNDVIKHKIKHNTQRFITSMKWIIFSILSGLVIGGIGSAFYGCIKMVTELRMEHLWLLYLLPLGTFDLYFHSDHPFIRRFCRT